MPKYFLNSLAMNCRQAVLLLTGLIISVASVLCTTSSYAENYAAGSKLYADNKDACSVNLPEDMEWTPTETWAWDRLCRGLTADLSEYDHVSLGSDHEEVACDPKAADIWPETRKLGLDFLAILSDAPYSDIVVHQGLSLRCAYIEGGVDLFFGQQFEQSVLINNSFLEGGVDISGSRVKDSIALNNSFIEGDVWLERIQVAETIRISGTTITGALYAPRMTVIDNLDLKGSSIKSIGLAGANMGSASVIDVHINGDVDLTDAVISDHVLMYDADITGDLLAKNMILDKDFTLSGVQAAFVDMSGARIGGNVRLFELGLTGAGFKGNGLTVQGDVDIQHVAGVRTDAPMFDFPQEEPWDDSGGAALRLSGGIVNGSVNIESLSIGALMLTNMVIDRSFNVESSDINLALFFSSTIRNMLSVNDNSVDVFVMMGGQFNHVFIDALCANRIYLASTVVQGNMGLLGSTVLGDVSFDMSEIGGNVGLRSVIGGDLDFSAISIGENLGLGGEYLQDIKLDLTRVGGSVLLTEGRFLGRVDLRGIEVGRELVLATSEQELPDWEDGVELSLRDAQVGDLRHIAASWLDLGGRYGITGLQYERLIFEDGDIPGQEPVWVLSWLRDQKNRGTSFNPQPYEELANALHRSGFVNLSNDVSVMARDHELVSQDAGVARKINLFLQKYIIGYGYQTWRAFVWLALLIVIGVYVSGKTYWGRRVGYARRLFFSMDMLLPQVAQLDKRHEELKLGGNFIWCPELPLGIGAQCKTLGPLTMPVQYYFFLHKLVGSVLVLFAIAGLSGLTK